MRLLVATRSVPQDDGDPGNPGRHPESGAPGPGRRRGVLLSGGGRPRAV